ncbi:hypothetical protein [Algivirga pacifica]
MKTFLLILSLFFLISSCHKQSKYQSNHQLIIAEDHKGLSLWDGNNPPTPIFKDLFNNKTFVYHSLSKTNDKIRIGIVDSLSLTSKQAIYKWSYYSINLDSMNCTLQEQHEYVKTFKKESSNKTYYKQIKGNEEVALVADTLISLKYILPGKIELLDKIQSIDPSIKMVEKGAYQTAYLKQQDIFLMDSKQYPRNIYHYDGYFDAKTGNGIFDISLSQDEKTLLVPILETSLLQFFMQSGTGKVLLFDTSTGELTQTISKRMKSPKLSPNNNEIAYSNKGEIRVYNLNNNKETIILSGKNSSEYIWIQ